MADGSGALFEHLRWTALPVGADASYGTVSLSSGRGGTAKPHALITCGIHGDEGPWSAAAVRNVLELPVDALEGSLTVVMAANPLAAQADARNAPLDTLDLNRTFPGAEDGSHTERLAHALTQLTDGIDVAIDLHGGGSWCVNAFVYSFPGCEDLARAVGAPFLAQIDNKPGSLTYEAASRGARVVGIEIGGRSRAEEASATKLSHAIVRVLKTAGVLADSLDVAEAEPAVPVQDMRVLRPPVGGVLMPEVREDAVGTVVPGGTVLGTVCDMATLRPRHTFAAPYEETAILLLRPHMAVVEGGAMTYVVARPRR